jgi:integrase/recombinase XerD
MKLQLDGFWAQDIWPTTEIPVPHNTPNRHPDKLYLRFATHLEDVNTELKYALMLHFTKKKWNPWYIQIVRRLNLFTKFVNQTVGKDELETLLARPLKSWELRFSSWLQKNHPQGFDPKTHHHAALSFLRMVYATLAEFSDQRDEWDKEQIDLRKVGLQIPTAQSGHILNLNLIQQNGLREIVRQYLRQRVDLAAGTLCHQLGSFVHFSRFLQNAQEVQEPAQVTRALILKFINYLMVYRPQKSAPFSANRRAQILGHLKMLFESTTGFARFLIFEEDIPKSPKSTRTAIKSIPDTVVEQLLVHQNALAEPFRSMLLVILEIGCRVGELCELGIDCLSRDTQGDYYVKRYAHKQRQSITVPVSEKTAKIIQAAQLQAKAQYGESEKYRFPQHAAQSYRPALFNRKINNYIAEQQITDDNGQLWHFTAKQCRHTVGTRLINSGVSQPTVQRFLGHQTARMTDVYAHLHDQTLKEAFFKYQTQINS